MKDSLDGNGCMTEKDQIYHRFEAHVLRYADGRTEIVTYHRTFRLERTTAKGAWYIEFNPEEPGLEDRTWRSSTTRFLWPSEELALESLRRRSLARFKFAELKLQDAERILAHLGIKPPKRYRPGSQEKS